MADLVEKPTVEEEAPIAPGESDDATRSFDWRTIALTSAAALFGMVAAISQIAQMLGYSEHSAFVHSFTKLVGTSPSVYRAGDESA